jgi:prepilin-type N-terminal cleavage/methylation domain-containing protein
MKRRGKRGFTLIELLVVIAIIAILAAILFPVFAQARESARKANCMSNMKQLTLATLQYIQDYDEMFPGSDEKSAQMPTSNGWNPTCNIKQADGAPGCFYGALYDRGIRRGYSYTWEGGGTALVKPYFKTDAAVFCPNQDKVDAWYTTRKQPPEYAYNLNFQWLGRLAQQQYPAQKVLLIDTFNSHDGQYPFNRYCCWKRGELQMNCMTAFVDGHVKFQNLGRGCGNPSIWASNVSCQQWQACNSGPPPKYNGCCPENYGCSGVSGYSPDFP